jgi:parvulin-like peptidyl-prolyl isomerase
MSSMSDPPRPSHPAPASPQRATRLLGLGAAAGLALAAAGLLTSSPESGDGLPAHAVAAVNGEIVRVEEYQRAVQALASDRREPLSEEDRRHVLKRLLDEELLVQRGLELGLARHDRRVRGDIVSAVIQSVVVRSEETSPDDEALRAFYEDNSDYFAQTGRSLVQQILVREKPVRSGEEARARAREAARRLRDGESFAAVDEALGDRQVAPVPRDYLPASKLREYLGPTATHTALRLAVGDVSQPIRSSSGYHVIQLVDREPGRTPPLDEIEEMVRAEWVRRAGDRALREYLGELHEQADVRVVQELP